MSAHGNSTSRERNVESESRFRKNIFRIVTATTASQAILLCSTPVLTRQYAPEEFGTLGVFTAFQAIIACIFTFKYEHTIIIERDNRKAFELTILAVVLSLGLSVALLVALVIASALFDASFGWHYFLLPFGIALTCLYTCGQQWAGRANDFRRYSRSQVVNAVVNVATAMILGGLFPQVHGLLVIGYVAGLAAAFSYLSFDFERAGLKREQRALPSRDVLVAGALEYRRFPLFVLPSAAMATLAQTAQPFVLRTLFTLRDVGHYAIASRFLLVPGALIGGAVSEAFRAEFVDRLRRNLEVSAFFTRTLARLAAFALPVFSAGFVVAPPLFALVFGAAYESSGVLARYLCLGVFAQFVSMPFGYVFVALGRVRLGLAVQTTVTLLPLLGLFVGGLSGDLERSVLISSFATLAAAGLLIGLGYRSCREADRRTARLGAAEP